jgi:hypothetical protein
MLTADTITDEQIRELGRGADRRLRTLCKLALNDAPTYLRASVVRDARRRLAAMIEASIAPGAGRVSSEPMAKTRGPGRPPRDGKKPAGRFEMRVTEREQKAWSKAADAAGVPVAAWLRGLANKAAGVDVPAVSAAKDPE